MIDVYGGDSPNVIKVLIALEELGLAYVRRPLDIMKGEQFGPAFLAINPNGKIPAIVDHAP
ncbi:MAG TPA: glutathione S-transferase N-terminal domain-containing protein, partial [Sphingomonas sp.]|nr:glutathione S-transferase N-terminal domain-containing protein [Sphingomonas sp.]